MSARAVARAYSIDELRRLARKRLPRAIFGFIDGGAEDELTLRDNRAAFERVRLAAMDCDGLVVSNHGGRQLDGAVATLDALPAIARAVGGKMSVLLDGGVRRGADVVKALALGAEAVMLGRATLYGACAGGEPGAARALEILSDELVRSMQLCGLRNVAEIGADLLAPPRQA
jgi:isopentenyl diphosphate isomerase/L-lactate dehydrogenase-like FMN-dependent dehydrogenase